MINYKENISHSGLSIYDSIDVENPDLYIPTQELENILSNYMVGISLDGLALRSRSRFVKEKVCEALGYPIPKSFKKSKPKFPGQNFDVYTQKRMNVQIWNEEVDAKRRYVFFKINENDIITRVKIITGDVLAKYDNTGTLTKKYQATMTSYGKDICSINDTATIKNWIVDVEDNLSNLRPNSYPKKTALLPINEVFRRLKPMVGKSISYIDAVQERNRGAELHSMICNHLGYSTYEDDGTYPDIFNQLLEVKLQTSPTIDLGLHSPLDNECIISFNDVSFYSKDIRYAIFDGEVCGNQIKLRNLYLVTGEEFTNYFPLFKGKVTNAKIQLSLPKKFFD